MTHFDGKFAKNVFFHGTFLLMVASTIKIPMHICTELFPTKLQHPVLGKFPT
jgi:hypothetical protein